MRRSRSLQEPRGREPALDVELLEEAPADLAVELNRATESTMPNIAPRPSSVRQVPDLALDLEVALVGAVLPAVAVEAVAGADADVDGEHRLDLDLEVAEAERALLDQAEQARRRRASQGGRARAGRGGRRDRRATGAPPPRARGCRRRAPGR